MKTSNFIFIKNHQYLGTVMINVYSISRIEKKSDGKAYVNYIDRPGVLAEEFPIDFEKLKELIQPVEYK